MSLLFYLVIEKLGSPLTADVSRLTGRQTGGEAGRQTDRDVSSAGNFFNYSKLKNY